MGYPTNYTFNLPNAFYIALRDKLEEMRIQENKRFRERPRLGIFGSRYPPPNYDRYGMEVIPPLDIVKKIVEITYWASMEREEERPLRFRICYAKPVSPDESNLCFKQKIPFTEREIVRLAPSINLSSNIALWYDEKEGLCIWGRTTFSMDPFALRAIDPGKIVIQFEEGIGRKNVAVVSLGTANFLSDNWGSRYSEVWDKLGRNEPEGEYDGFLYEKISALANIIKSMRSVGHGGTLIIIPPNANCANSISSIAYESQSTNSRLRFCLNELRANESDYKEKDQWRSLAESSAQEIAELTTVDGATILTSEFGIIGYGAKLQPASPNAEAISLIEKEPFPRSRYESQTPLEKIGGMRHQSAARFVYDNKEAIAIVVSQDSTVTCFAWVNWIDKQPTLMAIRKLEISLL